MGDMNTSGAQPQAGGTMQGGAAMPPGGIQPGTGPFTGGIGSGVPPQGAAPQGGMTPFDQSANWMQGAGGAYDAMQGFNPQMLGGQFGTMTGPNDMQAGAGGQLAAGLDPMGNPISNMAGGAGGQQIGGADAQGNPIGSMAGGAGGQQIGGADARGNYFGKVNFGQGSNIIRGSGNTGDYIGDYMNPYTDEVIDRTQQDITGMRDEALNQVKGNAALSGAFGSGRHGLLEGQVYQDAGKQMADTSANMRRQGYMDAAGLAGQHVGQDMARGGALAGLQQQNIQNTMQGNRDVFGREMQQGSALADLQGRDISNTMAQNQNIFGREMQQGGALAGLQGQDNANTMAQNQAIFGRGASQAGQLSNLQGQDVANQFQDWSNMYDVAQGDRAATTDAAKYGNAVLGEQARGYQSLSGDAFNTGQDLLKMQGQQGDVAQGANQDLMNMAQNIFGGNNPNQVANQIQQLLSGSPLTGNQSGTTTQKPSAADTFGTIMGGFGDLMGGK